MSQLSRNQETLSDLFAMFVLLLHTHMTLANKNVWFIKRNDFAKKMYDDSYP